MAAGWGAGNFVRARATKGGPFGLILLAVLACGFAVCALATTADGNSSQVLGALLACTGAGTLALFLLRHGGLAILTACAPLPGLFATLAAAPRADPATMGAALAMGLVVALLLGDTIAGSRSSAEFGEAAFRKASRANMRLAGAVIAAFAISTALEAVLSGWRAELPAAAAGVLTLVSTVVVVHFGAAYLDFGESFIARANRSRERFARLFMPILEVAGRRFGFSVFGIGCVLGAIAFFGVKSHAHALPGHTLPVALSCVVSACAGYLAVRDWRRCVAIGVSLVLAFAAGAWVAAQMRLGLAPMLEGDFLTAAPILLALHVFVAQEAVPDIETEDDAVAGSERAIETKSMAVCVAGLAGIFAALLFGMNAPAVWIADSALVLIGAATAIMFQPAIAITIENLVPRAATIAARYKIR
jgi:hypothetical protein